MPSGSTPTAANRQPIHVDDSTRLARLRIQPETNTSTAGTFTNVEIVPTYNQASGTAANSDIVVNRTETAVGSGAQNFIDFQVAGSSKFKVSNAGVVTTASNLVVGGSITNSRSVVSAAATLTAAQSGSLCILDALTGTLYTLPAPAVGLWFEFAVSVTNTSGSHKVITNAGTVFLKGSVLQAVEDTTPAAGPGPKDFLFNGSTHVAIAMNGSTTGGLFGTRFKVECISATVWLISGYVKGSGNIATPAATS